ncbi:endonuclease [Streptomyces sp. ISL-10]|uniref:endonuclease n=1 Tax=Streptomyces sp. ISL-10 TaxID=2819172 RepID=UPI001BE847F1|nr:endonuclease [Streptomyces sp. ISL-10]MBT2366067.1 endonuclease [Streptomyces sp. ISL-10]
MTARTVSPPEQREVLRVLLDEHGPTYAEEAGIRLRDTPQPLYRLLVLTCLLSARIRSSAAVASARELSEAGMRSARAMADASWQDRVDALGRGGYRRYDESTATQLGKAAELVIDKYGGDLRRMREEAGRDAGKLRKLLREVPGLGPAGVEIFLREVQSVWPEAGPLLDDKALEGARRLGLPADAETLLKAAESLRSTPHTDPAHLAAALVRAAVDSEVADAVRTEAGATAENR